MKTQYENISGVKWPFKVEPTARDLVAAEWIAYNRDGGKRTYKDFMANAGYNV